MSQDKARYQRLYNEQCKQLNQLVSECEKAQAIIKNKITSKEALKKQADDALAVKDQIDKAGVRIDDPDINPHHVDLSTRAMETYEEQSRVLGIEIENNNKIHKKMEEIKTALLNAFKKDQGGDIYPWVDWDELKKGICTGENKALFKKHSEGWDFWTKLVALFNKLTKTTGEKLVNKLDEDLISIKNSFAQIKEHGFYIRNDEVKEIPIPKGPKYTGL